MAKVSKSSYTISPEQKLARSMAAYKAHATRQQFIIDGSAKGSALQAKAQAALKAVMVNIKALTAQPKKVRKAKVAATVTAPAPAPTTL